MPHTKRITPAGAGKTNRLVSNAAGFEDHPRRCGENPLLGGVAGFAPGSPPQVRGKRCLTLTVTATRRITPAGAGKTIYHQVALCRLGDHPRRCGENGVFLSSGVCVTGSPPQVRGKRGAVKCLNIFAEDHPRRCGENRLQTPVPIATLRITPAGAGKTSSIILMPYPTWDHPRRCGENSILHGQATKATGSPPQVRGKRRVYPVC